MIIREVREKDLPSVCEIEASSFGEDAFSQSYLKMLMSAYKGSFLVAQIGGAVVGYVVAAIERGGIGHIVSIAVHPKYRRRGIGTELLKALTDTLQSKELSAVWLEVRQSNKAAIRLYGRIGFEVIGRIRGYYSDGEDAIIMSKTLKRKSLS